MRMFNIKVDGREYQVEVEELSGNQAVMPAPSVMPAPVATAPAAAKPAVSVGKGEQVKCPMPGTIMKLMATDGASVKRGQVLFVLEAMKMENDIVAPVDGIFKAIAVKGATVNTGDVLGTVE